MIPTNSVSELLRNVSEKKMPDFSLTATTLPENPKAKKTNTTKKTNRPKSKSENYVGCYRIVVLRFFFVVLCVFF